MAGALESAMADASRIEAVVKSAGSRYRSKASIGQKLATSSNWNSYASIDLSNDVERYQHFIDWVYVCVNAIAQRIAGQPIRVARAKHPKLRGSKAFFAKFGTKGFLDNLEPLPDHPFLDAVNTPNPMMVASALAYTTAASLKLTGKSHWWMAANEQGGTEIWPLPSHWVRWKDDTRTKWIIRPWTSAGEGWEVDADKIALFNLPDPGNPFLAKSPLATQAAAVTADELIQRSQAIAFQGIQPQLAIRLGNAMTSAGGATKDADPPLLDTEQRGNIVEAVLERWGGVARAGYPIILDALIRDVFPISNKPNEMDFLNSGKATKSRIFQSYGVNPLIVGEIEGANRAQAVVAEQSFLQNVINPCLELMSQVLTRWVVPIFAPGENLVAWFEPARPNDPEMTIKEWELGLRYGTVTRNEYRQRVLSLPAEPGGDVFYVPTTMIRDDAE